MLVSDTPKPIAPDGLVEREAELRELDDALTAPQAGVGSLVVIEGPPGIGKSRLLGWLRERALARGMSSLEASGLELEAGFAFGLARRLLEPALEAMSVKDRGALLARAPSTRALFEDRLATDLAGGADHGYALVHGLRQLLIALADREPLLVCLDDAHWSDGPSLRWLALVGSGLEGVPVTLALTTRRRIRDAPAELAHVLALPAARMLRPHALSQDAVERMVHSAYPDAAPEFCTACAQASQGNPFYLTELLRSARAEGMDPSGSSAEQVQALLPDSVTRSVLLRLARLPEPAAAVASACAVLGDGACLRHAAALADVDVEAAERAADILAAAHILRAGEPLSFAHPLVAAAIGADLPALARSRMHRRAAELLRDDGASTQAIAVHLLACRGEGDPVAVDTLLDAARQAAGQGDHRAARRLLERAVAEPAPPSMRPELEVELALTDAALGTSDALARVSAALNTAEVARRIEVRRALARLLFARSDFDAAAAALDEAMQEGPRSSELAVEAMVAGSLASAPPPSARRFVRQLLAGAPPTDRGLAALLAGLRVDAARPAAEVSEAARYALAGLSPDDGFYGVIFGYAVCALIAIDELDPAETATERALATAAQVGSLIATGTATHWRCELRYHRGALVDAIADARHTLAICDAGWSMCRAYVAPVLAHALMDSGDPDGAEQAVALAERSAGESRQRAPALAARGRLALLRGDPDRALEDLLAAGEHAERHAVPPTLLPWRSWAALVAGQLGREDLAVQLAHGALERARAIGAPRTLGLALRAAGAARGGSQGLALLHEAVAVLDRSPSALERARALVGLGVALRRDGQPAASREPLRRGLELAERLDARPLSAQARAELRAAGGRRRRNGHGLGVAGLTASEHRIARLAAQGLSTPEIARTLYVTPKTVDWHLGHAYQKLGISSRRQLPTLFPPGADAAAAGTEPSHRVAPSQATSDGHWPAGSPGAITTD